MYIAICSQFCAHMDSMECAAVCVPILEAYWSCLHLKIVWRHVYRKITIIWLIIVPCLASVTFQVHQPLTPTLSSLPATLLRSWIFVDLGYVLEFLQWYFSGCSKSFRVLKFLRLIDIFQDWFQLVYWSCIRSAIPYYVCWKNDQTRREGRNIFGNMFHGSIRIHHKSAANDC